MSPRDLIETWPLPLRLLAALCGEDADIMKLASAMSPADWDRFAELCVSRHRVASSLLPKLGDVGIPAAALSGIQSSVQQMAMQSLQQMAETRRICDRMKKAGLEPLVFKGWPLAQQLYGQPAGRHARDIDMLIPPRQIGEADAAMRDLGYRQIARFDGVARLVGTAGLDHLGRDIEYFHPDMSFNVEIHWHMHPFRCWPDPVRMPGGQEHIDTQAGRILVPSQRANLQYLAAHGCLHLWCRLKWLLDIDRIARELGTDGLEVELDAASSSQVYRAVAQALRMSAHVFGSPLPARLSVVGGLDRWLEQKLIGFIADDKMTIAQNLRFKTWTRVASLALSNSIGQALGIVGFDLVTKPRLAFAIMRSRRQAPQS